MISPEPFCALIPNELRASCWELTRCDHHTRNLIIRPLPEADCILDIFTGWRGKAALSRCSWGAYDWLLQRVANIVSLPNIG